MIQKNTATPKAAALIELREQFSGNERASQRHRLMAALRAFASVSTIEARRYLDVMHPAGRINELREEGADIVTLRHAVETEAGEKHLVGVYMLRRGASRLES